MVRNHWYQWLPILFLAISLPITFYIWQHERNDVFNEHQLKFDIRAKEASSLINKQLSLHKQSLLGIQSFFRASSYVNEVEFNHYVELLLVPQLRYGLQEIGFAEYIALAHAGMQSDRRIQALIATLESNNQADYAPIIYLMDAQVGAQGVAKKPLHDAFSNPLIRQSMFKAARLDMAVISDAVSTTPNEKNCQCFSMLQPIRKKTTADLNKVEANASINGWVFFNINYAAFFETTLKKQNDGYVKFSVYDSENINNAQLLYENKQKSGSHPPFYSRFSRKSTIKTIGLEWILVSESTPLFESTLSYYRANQIGILGVFTNLALAGIFYLLFAHIRALNDMKTVNKQLATSEQRWQFALEGAGDGVWDWDVAENKVMFSKRWKEMLGFTEEELTDHYEQWKKLIHPEDYPAVLSALNASLRGRNNHYSIECRMLCKDGSWKWILSRGLVVTRNTHAIPMRMVGTHTDISHLKESEQAVWRHANFDSLTGLPNRRMFYTKLEHEIQKAKRCDLRVGLIFLDLDGFKEVNDTLGHDQGDLLLQITAERLVNSTRKTDSVARLGGDEFVVLIAGVEQENSRAVESVSQKILKTISEPFELSYEKAYVSASLGIVIYPDDAMGIDGLLKSVDQAMYASKRRGGNCFTYFTPKMQEIAFNRMQLSNDLRMALARQELFIEYQPIMDLRTGQIYKAEALLRWQHPVRGLVPPIEFIPIAEETRLINEIGNWVFEQAITQVMQWRESLDPKFQVAVNKSAVQFNNEEVDHHGWFNHLERSHQDGSAVVVEITESLLLDASNKVKKRLKLFQQIGIQVALDDFGTGYSSLSYLKKFDIDYLKIDRSFVANLEEASDDYLLCEAIIMMAHRLGIKVIAEGIETEQQKNLLIEAGCDFGQGYYFSRPVLPEKLEAYVKEHDVRKNKVS